MVESNGREETRFIVGIDRDRVSNSFRVFGTRLTSLRHDGPVQ